MLLTVGWGPAAGAGTAVAQWLAFVLRSHPVPGTPTSSLHEMNTQQHFYVHTTSAARLLEHVTTSALLHRLPLSSHRRQGAGACQLPLHHLCPHGAPTATPGAAAMPWVRSRWTWANTSGEASPGAAEAGLRLNNELGSVESHVQLL